MQDVNLNGFLEQLKFAAKSSEPVVQVYQLMQRVFGDHIEAVADVFRTLDDDVMLFEDGAISIWHYRMPTGVIIPPHDHQVAAMIGVYEGIEENHFYKVMDDQLVHQTIKRVAKGEVLLIDPEDIHSVQTANNQRSCVLHVYLGEFTKVKRYRFDKKTGEMIPLTGLEGLQEEPLLDA